MAKSKEKTAQSNVGIAAFNQQFGVDAPAKGKGTKKPAPAKENGKKK